MKRLVYLAGFNLKRFILIYVYLCVSMCTEVQVPAEARRGLGSPEARVTGTARCGY